MAYNKDIIKKVLSGLENKNKDAYLKAEQKKQELYIKIPELKKIDDELSDTGLRVVREILKQNSNAKDTVEKLKSYNNELLKKRKAVFKQHNIDESVCEPVFECNDCKDTGYINSKTCKCLKRMLATESIISSGLGHIIREQTFENFNFSFYKTDDIKRDMAHVVKVCRTFANEFNAKTSNNLLFFGGTGLGKTHLSSAIASIVINNGYEVVYSSAQNIISNFEKDRFINSSKEKDTRIDTDRYLTCDLLIIDDLGVEQNGSMTVPTVYNILDTRLKDRKSTIISTNFSFYNLQKKYDDRIVSRLLGEFKTLQFAGSDIRLQKVNMQLEK